MAMTDKLIITCEIDAGKMPEGSQVLDFRITIVQDGLLTRVFKDWKKVTYIPAVITKMTVEKP